MVKKDSNIQSGLSKSMLSSSSSSSPPSSSSSARKKYKGVRMRSWGSWVSEVRAPNQKTRIWLGSYSTPEAAARAYDAALLCLKGSSANLNFPITSSSHIPDTVMSPKSIQRVAAAAANNYYHNATIPTLIPTTPSSPSPPPPSSSSSLSSPSPSPSDHVDDEVFLSPYWPNCTSLGADDQMCLIDPWNELGGFHSPRYIDQMFNSCAFFDPSTSEELYEEGDNDIRLWSFC